MEVYKVAADLAHKAENGISYKNNLYRESNLSNVKKIHLLAVNTVKKRVIIDKLISRLSFGESITNEGWLPRVLLYELIYGKPHHLINLSKNHPIITDLLQHKEMLFDLVTTIEDDESAEVSERLITPIYIRFNTETTTRSEVIEYFRGRGFNKLSTPSNYQKFIEKVKNIQPKEFMLDLHLPCILIFNRKDSIHLSGDSFFKQDKSSCLVIPLLAPLPGASILDMCAAPGLKSQHAASFISRMGMIYSVDRNKSRFNTMKKLFKTYKMAGNSRAIHYDSLKITNEMCPNVEYIIVDPPCSGTGMVDTLFQHARDEEQLQKLGNLQATILKHALREFPCVRRVIYSTCSIMEQENEKVVSECLELAETLGFKLVPLKGAYRGSFQTGRVGYPCSSSVLRVTPEIDLTNGFFIALFERSQPLETPDSKKTSTHFLSPYGIPFPNDEESEAEGEESEAEGEESEAEDDESAAKNGGLQAEDAGSEAEEPGSEAEDAGSEAEDEKSRAVLERIEAQHSKNSKLTKKRKILTLQTKEVEDKEYMLNEDITGELETADGSSKIRSYSPKKTVNSKKRKVTMNQINEQNKRTNNFKGRKGFKQKN